MEERDGPGITNTPHPTMPALPAALQHLNGPHRVAAVPDPKLLAKAKEAAAETRVAAAAVSVRSRHHLPALSGGLEPSLTSLPGKAAAASVAHIDIEVSPTAGGSIPFTKITLVWRDLK